MTHITFAFMHLTHKTSKLLYFSHQASNSTYLLQMSEVSERENFLAIVQKFPNQTLFNCLSKMRIIEATILPLECDFVNYLIFCIFTSFNKRTYSTQVYSIFESFQKLTQKIYRSINTMIAGTSLSLS